VYTTFQFLGAFAGGACGGLALEAGGIAAVLALCALIALLWLPIALGMRPPANLANHLVRLPVDEDQAEAVLARLRGAPGVADMLVMREEATVYLKVDTATFDMGLLDDSQGNSLVDAGIPTPSGS
jgi:hypothetical protein